MPLCHFCYITSSERAVSKCPSFRTQFLFRFVSVNGTLYFHVRRTHFTGSCSQNIKCLVQKNAIWDTSRIGDSSWTAIVQVTPVSFQEWNLKSLQLNFTWGSFRRVLRSVASSQRLQNIAWISVFLPRDNFLFFPSPRILPEPLKVIQISQVVFRITALFSLVFSADGLELKTTTTTHLVSVLLW